ncbi:head-tail adaptor Ad2 [Synechococcus phage Bellamy]|uniref:Neck protein n=1 Tax=Synechococcus phage Bellamy TaxID=2023996 RepID=A0A222YWS2_9CAUD|nr:head-tail adaptor Ad2 [Synechococcus phage Bellamy]ASR76162.1 neck protein [Synechococcus phage Bellamy]
MAQPASRTDLINYCKRQLGAPVLEINIADEQVDDLVDDALQYFHERHFDGVIQTFLKYKITQDDIDRGRARGGNNPVGIVTTTATSTVGISSTFSFEENSNFLQIPPAVLGINKIFRFDGSNTVTNNMFSVKYQLFLNDVYTFSSTEILSYAMTKRYLEDLDFALGTEKYIRFNKRQDRLYLDFDWGAASKDDYLIIDCYRLIDPNDFTRVYNDSFLKKYLTALMKRQWGQNLIKFQGVKLPGGIELNGRQIYDDAEKDLEIIREQMSNTYELPPLDMIG